MKVTLFMAISVNGIIAREDGSEDFLSEENWQTFSGLVKEFGNFIVGSRTYEAVKQWDEGYGFDDFPEVQRVVISDSPSYELDAGYTLATSPQDAIRHLQKAGFERALLTGGATNNSSFAKANLIDEVNLNVEPVIVGEGIPLFHPAAFDLPLELVETKPIGAGVVQLRYNVRK